ncbi:hypothetical protein PIROE2DRAFT_3868 [Piromyces sp. E2]|nr:hypothetical protein PIROE2DRAFT_3868 [Piromyces sp. E2]|eukprot:OUM68423.1 hypothetical protein PIROE2DRAFT_3868 [Piromyces sp. E2]
MGNNIKEIEGSIGPKNYQAICCMLFNYVPPQNYKTINKKYKGKYYLLKLAI